MPEHYLSKSRFTLGLQCSKQLYFHVHEPNAPELTAADSDPARAAVFATGHRVGDRARAEFPGGVLISRDEGTASALAATAAALNSSAPAIYEACVRMPDGSLIAYIDVLLRTPEGFTLIEVKASSSVKSQYIPDAAIQTHIARAAGIPITRVELMHLNSAHRHPSPNPPLFTRADITARVEAFLPTIPTLATALHTALAAESPPEVAPGDHCTAPYDCAFLSRCWAEPPPHSVGELYMVGKKQSKQLEPLGIRLIAEIPSDHPLPITAARQRRAVKHGRLLVEPTLAAALAALEPPIAHYDFETVWPALPAFDGSGPYGQVPVQFSVHRENGDGTYAHRFWLASPGVDPRRECAEALIAALADARTLLSWYADFEISRVRELAARLPDLAAPLEDIAARTVDLLPIVRDHVYHPDFRGSFSLKGVAPALVEGIGYDDLEISDGGLASTALETYLLRPEELTVPVEVLKPQLLAYCERDTWVMVKVLERLRGLVAS